MTDIAVIETLNLSKSYPSVKAVDNLNLVIKKGEVFGFLGPNGAGKTTTINMICGLLKPDGGAIMYDGSYAVSDRREIRRRIGLCPQEQVVWDYLTCEEQLLFAARMYGLERERAKVNSARLIERLGLGEKRKKTARTLSGGLKRRLNIALALVHDPSIVIMDEPEAGLDPQSRVMVRKFIKSLAPEKTVIFTTHNMDEAERVCDRVGIIDRGKMLVCDKPDNLKKSVGDGDVLEITAVGIKNKKRLENNLKKSLGKGLRGITFIENRVILRTPDGARQLPAITEILKKEKVDIEDIRFRWNTLEDVFINLTGRSLRQ